MILKGNLALISVTAAPLLLFWLSIPDSSIKFVDVEVALQSRM